ncbi:Aspartyl-tRNA(Asn)/Glutamyl-tRNA(Gln) amidotransferase subunit A [Streptococcus sp. HSISS2]|nr:Aspartyl-tRNA(Asn)/Glutamyl-tRNA(Gln) amidotransferase subunit A [Streptococcus sp. HSISS2]
MSFNNKTIEELHDLLVSKEISATELTQATLDDIKAREEAVNAFVTVAEEAALDQAKAIDEKESMQITSCQGFRLLSKIISQQMAS